MISITLKGIIDEDFVNYKVPSMTLMFPKCSFKCGETMCQNSGLLDADNITIDIDTLCKRYINNPISEAIVCQGLEPFDSFSELLALISRLRIQYDVLDDIVIYTGYERTEIEELITKLKDYKNIVVKFGRYIQGDDLHNDKILGVNLASSNQYAERIC